MELNNQVKRIRNKKNVRKSILASKEIKIGEIFTEQNITPKRIMEGFQLCTGITL